MYEVTIQGGFLFVFLAIPGKCLWWVKWRYKVERFMRKTMNSIRCYVFFMHELLRWFNGSGLRVLGDNR